MKHMVVDKGDDEEFTDEDVYGLNTDSTERESALHTSKGHASRQELWVRLQEFRPYMQTDKAEDFLVLIDRLQESCSRISSTSHSLPANQIDALRDTYSQYQINTFKAMLNTLHNRQSTSAHSTVADPPDPPL